MLATLLLVAAIAPADDIAKFEGSWRIESMEMGGKAMDVGPLKETRLVLKGHTWAQGEAKGTFTIDAAKTPKTIDLKFTEGPPKGTVLKGIYELDDSTYKLCVGPPNGDRPRVFDSKGKDGGTLQVLKKVKP
jgi:uncharacterized protein (TIGR03067 family)